MVNWSMPDVIDDAKGELESNWKPAAAYGAGTGVGRAMFGPIGHGAGALLAGSYTGGSVGNAMTTIGMGEALAMVLNQGMGGGNSGGSGTTEV